MDELSELVLRCTTEAGKEDINELLQTVHPDLILALKACCGNDALIDDFAQEAMTKIVRRIKTSRAKTFREFRSWCVTIAIRIAADYHRKSSVKNLSILAPADIEKLREAASEQQTSEFAHSNDAERALAVLESLGSPCCELLTLFYLHGLDYAEIAEIMGKRYDAVRIALGRCRSEAQGLFEKKAHYGK